jgi:D-aminopeptidase
VDRVRGMRSLREHGLRIGELEPGPRCSIADVGGVRVGHVTVVRDEPEVVRTGVTAIVPAPVETLFAQPLPAGVAVLNGAGEMTGSLQVAEWGVIQTPVYLTATMAVGRVYDGAVAAAVAADPAVGVEDVVIPVVAECDDSWLSDPRAVHVEAGDVGRAVAEADAVFAQGAVGAGTGMVSFDFKAGIGTASRQAREATVGVLVLANFGERRHLRIDGVPVGALLGDPDAARARAAGSCIVVVATDSPLQSAQLTRIARRAGLGLARTGSTAHHGSGEIFLALSTARGEPLPDADLDLLFEATVDATEEAVVNALWHAETMVGRDGRVAHALPHDAVLELLDGHRRLGVR